MAIQYCDYDIKGTLAVTGTSTLTGAVTITAATSSLLSIQNTTNGGSAAIRFIDTSSGTQPGDLIYKHSDSQSQGGGASWHFVAENPTHLVVGSSSIVGRVVVKSGSSATKCDYAFFDDVNTGMVRTSADNVSLVAGGIIGVGVGAAAVSLKYAGATKLATSSGGVEVSGGITTSAAININNPASDKKISFDRTGGKSMSIEHDASSMYFYNETDAVTMFKMFNAGSATVTGDFTVNGGDITLGGTGRIQGVDTVSASTDAANKAYVDAHDGGAGVYLPLAGGTMTGD